MKILKSLINLQLRDKIDLSSFTDKKSILRSLVFSIVKFLITALAVFGVVLLSGTFIFTGSDIPRIIVLITGVLLVLQLIACTFNLMKSLYFSEDNKVLITFPVKSNLIFISKLVISFVYELIRSLSFLIPYLLGCAFYLCFFYPSKSHPLLLLWIFVPVILINLLIVLLAGLLSIIIMYIYRFFKRFPIIEIISLFIFVILFVIGIVYLINLIPSNIDLINQWPKVSNAIHDFILQLESKLKVFSQLVYCFIGEYNKISLSYEITSITLLKSGIIFLSIVLLFFANFFISRPLFFKMMAKNFETSKGNDTNKPNKVHNKYLTFVNKEFIINFRTMNISLNYLIIYIAVPIMILFLNAMYKAMNTRQLGDNLIYAFNILLILLPMLASNALVATYYSREGRAAYIKRTKPILAIYPLFAKLAFNIIFSIPSIFISVSIFASKIGFTAMDTFVIGLTLFVIHLTHMILSAMFDVMNPQNEQYATSDVVENPNENKSTIFAFIISFAVAIFAYKVLSEASLAGNILLGATKLLIGGIILFIGIFILFVRRVKAFYSEL